MADPDPPRKVLVTGASGFIGAALAERLRRLGSEVVGVDRDDRDDPGVVKADVTRPGDWQRLAAGCDVVVHTAAVVGMYSSPDGYWEGNVLAPRLALDAAVSGGARRFVHLSSIVVFGFDFEGEVDERHPVRPNGVHYVDTKIASEQVVLAAHARREVACTIVRPGDVYGPRSRPWTIEPVRLLSARMAARPAAGRGLLSPVYVDDLVDGIVRAATVPDAAGETLTLTGERSVASAEFFGRYSAMLGVPPARTVPTGAARAGARALEALAWLRRAPNEVTPAAIDYLARRGTYSIARARAVLGYEPVVDLTEGMRRTEAWLRAVGLITR